ncbi:uncharacterized protein LOC129591429 [Paramacrobiotus metropolitanus]|uniref:uncharacterized protein LOC129591429 n=1 Tax=Paramacrobiotus metropolitanus TaxID=2943436 RepID=UPI00244613C4|nr:uncharacterized protein LOC129591429 [Paramacrobiotus metropolitanus]XP_055343049.1 uncharacterized protein LOC129591429 [Paramacrobiotus metropolitanus]
MEPSLKKVKLEDADPICPFHTLPIEVVAHVFSCLDIFDISQCSTVCKRWKVIAFESYLVQKSVIVDIQKWNKYELTKTDTVWRKSMNTTVTVYKGEPLLKRFVTSYTRHVILRWPLGTCPPEAELVLSSPNDCPDMYETNYGYDYSGPVSRCLDNIIKITSNIQRDVGHTISALTLQNLKLYTNHWNEIRDNFPEVHYDRVQINCHFEPTAREVEPQPFVLRVELDKKTLKKADIHPDCNDYRENRYYERFGLFIPAPLSVEEESCMSTVLRSPVKTGWKYEHFWNRVFGRQVRHNQSLAEMELTMDEIHTYPLWKQYLVRDLLQYYPLNASEITSNNSPGVRSAVQRVLGPFRWYGFSGYGTYLTTLRSTSNVPLPLW